VTPVVQISLHPLKPGKLRRNCAEKLCVLLLDSFGMGAFNKTLLAEGITFLLQSAFLIFLKKENAHG